MLPKPPLAASFPQSSEVGRKLLYSFVVVGGGDKLETWALWEFMSISQRALSTFLQFN
jgi:hypothetical protein